MSECTHDCSSCGESCASREPQSLLKAHHADAHVGKVYGIVSGKGGVGKSMVTSQLAVTMRRRGYQVGILDADITGPSIPKAFGIHDRAMGTENALIPSESKTGIQVMSINLLLENETLFGTLRATADDDDIFADFDGADFVDGVDHRQISTGEGGLDGMCADGKNDDVGTKSLCIFGRHESVHAKINIALFDLVDFEVEIAAVFILERRFHDNVDQTAEMIGFFAQRDIVSALCGGEGGLHAAGAAADDENLLAWAGRHNVDLPLAAEHGVDGAFADVRVERSIVRRTVCTGDAGAAAQAGDDLIFVAMVGLVDPARVGKECTTGGDHINFAAGDGLVSLLEVADTTNSTDGRLDSGLDGGSKGDIDAALGKHAGEELAAGGIEERGRGDVDQSNLAVEHLGKFNALFGAEAAFHEVVCGETVFDG